MHTVEKGDLSVAMITAKFLRLRWIVLKPITELSRYDLVIDRGNGFERVQCKTGRVRDGAVQWNTCSNLPSMNGARKDYRGEVDLFAVYCPETDGVYLIRVGDVGRTVGVLRCSPSLNGQKSGVKLAADYLL